MIPVRYDRGGVEIESLGLWLDPHSTRNGPEKVIVSHAHSDHIGRHREVIVTHATGKLMGTRLGGGDRRIEHCLNFGEKREFRYGHTDYQVTFLPAGHILGSGMAMLECEAGSLLYTGDFKLRAGPAAEPCEPRQAEVLIMETTFGKPRYRFPKSDAVFADIARFCHETLHLGAVPVLFAYSLGKTQELMMGLRNEGFSFLLHDPAIRLTRHYETFGYEFPPYQGFEPNGVAGKVVICPNNSGLKSLKNRGVSVRTAYVSGWALDPDIRFRAQTDAGFPLSDHADYDELLEFVDQVQPKKVYTLHGFAADFAQVLRDRGFDAEALSEADQLGLPLWNGHDFHASSPASSSGIASGVESEKAPEEAKETTPDRDRHSSDGGAGEMKRFEIVAEYCLELERRVSFAERRDWLEEIIHKTEASYWPNMAYVLMGRLGPFPNQVAAGIGWASVREILKSMGMDEVRSAEWKRDQETLESLVKRMQPSPFTGHPGLRWEEWQSWVGEFLLLPNKGTRLRALQSLFRKCQPLEAACVMHLMVGHPSWAVGEESMLKALGSIFNVEYARVLEAYQVVSDMGHLILALKQGNLDGLRQAPFRMIRFQNTRRSMGESAFVDWIASGNPVEAQLSLGLMEEKEQDPGTVEAVQMEGQAGSPEKEVLEWSFPFWVEPDYPGIRCQVHKQGSDFKVWNSSGEEITGNFGGAFERLKQFGEDVIVEGVLVAVGDQVYLPRERWIHQGDCQDLFAEPLPPLLFIAFDLLWRNGHSLLHESFRVRRKALERLIPWPEGCRLAQGREVASESEFKSFANVIRKRKANGVMAKRSEGRYDSSSNSNEWCRVEFESLSHHFLIVGVEWGSRGKQRQVIPLKLALAAWKDSELKDWLPLGSVSTDFLSKPACKRWATSFSKVMGKREGNFFQLPPVFLACVENVRWSGNTELGTEGEIGLKESRLLEILPVTPERKGWVLSSPQES